MTNSIPESQAVGAAAARVVARKKETKHPEEIETTEVTFKDFALFVGGIILFGAVVPCMLKAVGAKITGRTA